MMCECDRRRCSHKFPCERFCKMRSAKQSFRLNSNCFALSICARQTHQLRSEVKSKLTVNFFDSCLICAFMANWIVLFGNCRIFMDCFSLFLTHSFMRCSLCGKIKSQFLGHRLFIATNMVEIESGCSFQHFIIKLIYAQRSPNIHGIPEIYKNI